MSQLPLSSANRHAIFDLASREELGRWADFPNAVLAVAKAQAGLWEAEEHPGYAWGASPDLRKRKYVLMAVAAMDALKKVKDENNGRLF